MRDLIHDVRYAARLLVHAPGFAVVCILALALGIGANAAIFSVVNGVLLRPLDYRDPESLVVIWEHNLPRDRRDNVVSPGNYLHWREMNRVFADMGAVATFRATMSGRGEAEEVPIQYVTASVMPLLGVPPRLGRWFTTGDEAPDVKASIISERLWRQRFGADPHVVGQTVLLDGVSNTIVGVMPASFSVFAAMLGARPDRVDLWSCIGFSAEARTPRGRWLTVVGRLKPGVTLAQAQDDMTRVHAELTRLFPAFNTGWTARVVPMRDQLTGDVRPALLVMLGAVAFVLLIACANVGNLLLARATDRRREMAVRAALGAARGRLLRQMFAESLLLSSIGAAAGLLLAWWGVAALRTFVSARLPLPRIDQVAIDGRVLAFTAMTAAISGVAFGIFPALAAAGERLADGLKDVGRTASAGRTARIRSAFVVVEVGLALVLLVGAGLLLRSFAALIGVNPGFDPSHTLTVKVSIPAATYKTADQQRAFFDRLFERIDALPGVRLAGGTSFLPLNGLGAATSFSIVGQPKRPAGQEPVTDVSVVTHNYFGAMGIRLLRGRTFDSRDAGRGVRRVVVNEALARKYFAATDPIGQHIVVSWNDESSDEIVGVVGDVRQQGLDADVRPAIYWPPARFAYPFMTVAVRASGDPSALVSSVTSQIHQLDPNVAAADVRTLDDVVDRSVAQRRLTMTLLWVFALLALALAAVGVYGVFSYTVSQRTREIGIRMALGADSASVMRMLLREALALAGAGILCGTAASLVLTRMLQSLLFAVTPWDPITFGAVAGFLAAIATAAALLPGRRASRVDPLTALHAD
jgi:putative ABC transport system permease protein